MMSTMHVIKDIPENATLKKYEFKTVKLMEPSSSPKVLWIQFSLMLIES